MAPEDRLPDGRLPEGLRVAGRYRLLRTVAVGGMGQVWLAADDRLSRQVAIKKCALPDGLSDAQQSLVRGLLLREVCAFARVSHRNVVRILDVLPGEELWIVMEYVASRSLLQVIRESGPLPPDRVAAIGLAVLHGLRAAGRAGVLHLDVKPSNVLIGDDGRVVLADFGPAVTDESLRALSEAGIVLGSPKYIAPERLSGGVSTPQADLWSLGATLYHAVEGRPPYLRDSVAETLAAVAGSAPDPARRAGPLAGVLAGLLRHDPAERLAPSEVEAQLRPVAARRTPPTAATVPAGAAASRGLVADGPPSSAAAGAPGSTVAGSRGVVAAGSRGSGAARRWGLRPVVSRMAAGAAVLAVLAVLGGGAAATRQGGQAGGQPGGQPGIAVTPAPSPRAPFVLPRGYGWWQEAEEFRIAVPAGWSRGRDAAGVLVFRAPAGRPTLRISRWAAPRNVVAALVAEEGRVRLASYRRLRIEALPEPPNAVWEYTYRERRGTAMHGLHRVVAAAGRTYLIEWRVPRSGWAAELRKLAVVLDSFGPVQPCTAPSQERGPACRTRIPAIPTA